MTDARPALAPPAALAPATAPAPASEPGAAQAAATGAALVEPLQRPRWNAGALLATLAIGAVLYVGQAILVPLALATLLAFVLDPLVGWLRRVGLPRTPAVVAVMLATVLVLGATSFFVAGQVAHLAKNLPTYQSTVQSKLRALREQLASSSGSFDATSRMLDALGGELDAARRELAGPSTETPPIRVAMGSEPRSALQALGDLVEPLLGPLGTAGAVLLFLLFVLIERHDMRDRLLRLTGGDLHRSTDALGEAGQRVSRYLTMQLLVNLSYGLPLGLGLWLIGVPGAPLWGLLGALLRFVPYVGPLVAAVFPLTLAFAVDPGWQMVLWTLALVATLELIINNLVEPWLYGASTGLSALAIVVSAMFWTLLWGPVGLILATPLTVCLAVLGRHVTQLAWLDVLLGSEPVFDQPTRLYQRLLAGDVEEAIEMCEAQARTDGLLACYSGTAVPAMALAAREHSRAASAEHRHRVSTGMSTLLRSLRDELPPPDDAAAERPGGRNASAAGAGTPPGRRARVLCVGARWEVDTLAAEMLAHALAHQGVATRLAPAAAVSADHLQTLDLQGIEVLCLSVFSSTPEAQLRYIARRLKRRAPGLRLLVGLWNAPPQLLQPDGAERLGVDAVARTLSELVQRLQTWLSQPASGPAAPPTAPPQERQRVQALRDSGALAPARRALLDRAALRAADVLAAPMAMVTLVDADDALWQGAAGLDLHAPDLPRRQPRQATLCHQVVLDGAALFVPDIERDPRFAAHASRQALGLRSYAGAPLLNAEGLAIGTLCVVDTVPRALSEAEQALLQTMARSLMLQLARLARLSQAPPSAAADRAADTAHDAATARDGLGPLGAVPAA
ncbi:AI-2E family transporter [Aquabacterium sp. OR-4]|uniref:AI-2E family transporter n=1 Tax=Aquabacterium sp. OR-4 TaxID=2978127 RepID=UPI0028C8DE32|nr:AI-2E family transporter [Aquabacterium sp. OR-4]MDT7835024.1 AI-2E family transporter [Aquabacterium sp. OR-4]